MKKLLLVLGIITCMAGLTACGSQNQAANYISTQDAMDVAAGWVGDVSQIVATGSEATVISAAGQNGLNAAVFENAFDSWKSASTDMGDYVEVIEVTENSMEGEVYNGMTYPTEGSITARIRGTRHNAEVEIIYEEGMLISMSTNVEYSFGETMQKAALNTLLGMGTVFVVLILISFIISAFTLISKAEKPKTEPAKEEKAAPVVTPVVEEELSDDLELVAVIAAAIAAYEGSGSTDGYVVRSIRKRTKRV